MSLLQEQVQLAFGGGANPTGAAHLLADDQVATATNVDFGYERGAAAVRRGGAVGGTVAAGSTIRQIYRRPTNWTGNNPWYFFTGSAVYRGVAGTYTAIKTGLSGPRVGMTAYSNQTWIAPEIGTKAFKDDGTVTTDWVKQRPGSAPGLTVYPVGQYVFTTSSGAAVSFVVSGTNTGTTTSTASGVYYYADTDPATNKVVMVGTNVVHNLSTLTNAVFGTTTVGAFGMDLFKLQIGDPAALTRVSIDYSIGDTSFANCWHAEISPGDTPAPLDLTALIGGQSASYEEKQQALTAASGQTLNAGSVFTWATNGVAILKIRRPVYQSVGTATAGWTDLHAVRLTVEASKHVSDIRWFADHTYLYGAANAGLYDNGVPYRYYETWATLDSAGSVVGESAPSAVSTSVSAEGCLAFCTGTGTPTGNHGITHRIFYREGGLLQDAYAVASCTITYTGTYDFTNDIQALIENQPLLTRNNRPAIENNVLCASEPFYDRIVLGRQNQIFWSSPGTPDAFPYTSEADVSDVGDEVQGLVVWPPGLVVVNQYSIYELHGNTFEGANTDYVLSRTGSRHGSIAARAIIKTPYGIPLLNSDGIQMYVPGQGVDVPLEWAMDKLGDAWKGDASTDPATMRGTRVPPLTGFIYNAVAAWRDEKLYLGMATGAAAQPNTLFVLDFPNKQVWWHQYPWQFTSLWWDEIARELYAGTTDGRVMKLDRGQYDQTTAGVAAEITWKVRTRAWTVPTDTVLENISVDFAGGTTTVLGIYDGTATRTVGTITAAARAWSTPALGGTFANCVEFEFNGTEPAGTQSILYGIRWDALYEPKRVAFFKTDYDLNNYDGEKLWDVHYADLECFGTGSVFGKMWVDGTAVATLTVTSPTVGRKITPTSFPSETYGYQSYTVYTVSTGTGSNAVTFKHWDTHRDARNEPPRVTTWRTDIESLEESRLAAVDCDLNPNGTVVGRAVVDGTVVNTFTATGTREQSYSFACPPDTYGRTVYTTYTGTAFKHYKTWYHKEAEPDRLSSVQFGPVTFPSDQTIKTWVAQLNPLGTATGVLYANGTAVSTATFTGTRRTTFNVGLDLTLSNIVQQPSADLKAVYTSTTVLKHYDTTFETEAQPFGKTTWLIRYQKLGGATAIDLARQFALDIEGEGVIVPVTSTITSAWDIDGTQFYLSTHTFTGREWKDSLPFPPGGRGYNFQQRAWSAAPFKVWKSNLDILRMGLKGLSRVTVPGKPQ